MRTACADDPQPPGGFWNLLRRSGAAFEASIAGSSMLPTLAHGARVRLRPDPTGGYREGDVVVCVLKDELYAHRIVARLGRDRDACVVTLGDNRALCDPATRIVDILGRVESEWRGSDWCPLRQAPPRRRLARLAIRANCLLLAGCLGLHYGLARRTQGTLLWIARLPGLLLRRRP